MAQLFIAARDVTAPTVIDSQHIWQAHLAGARQEVETTPEQNLGVLIETSLWFFVATGPRRDRDVIMRGIYRAYDVM